MKRLLLAVPLMLSASLLVAAPAHADDRRCNGSIGATYVDGNVIVPKGVDCILRGTRVDGNVIVKGRAKLVARGVQVDGNIQAENHRNVIVTARKVQCKGNDPKPYGSSNRVSGDKEDQCRRL